MVKKRERAIDKYTKTGRNCYWIRSTTAAMQQKKASPTIAIEFFYGFP